MKYHQLLSVFFLIPLIPITGQSFSAKEGSVSFVANAPLEKIEGSSKKVDATFDAASYLLEISLDMSSFEFSHPLIKYHFEKYIAKPDSFPIATFSGILQKCHREDLVSGKMQDVAVAGVLSFHGINSEIPVTGQIRGTSEGSGIWVKSSFDLTLKDFGILIPPFVRDAWASVVQVQVEVVLQKILPK